MKWTRPLLALCALMAGACGESVARAALIDFNAPGDLAANFTNSQASPPIAEADSVGIGAPASRGLSVSGTTDNGSTLQTSSYDFSVVGAQLTASIYFHTAGTIGASGEARVLELNFVALSTNFPTAAHTGIGAKIEFGANVDDVLIRFRQNNADVALSLSPTPFDIKPNTWYKATFSATNQGTASTIPATMVLDDYGADGTALVTAGVLSHSFAIPASAAFTADNQVFAAFRVRNGTRLYNALDNFGAVQTAIPEPGCLGLASLGALYCVIARRRS